MTTLLYDGSFDGLLTAVFEVFEYRYSDVEIVANENYLQNAMFCETHECITNAEKAERVLKKLDATLGKQGISRLLFVFLSEKPERERLILRAVRESLKFPDQIILQNFADDDMMAISKICKSVGREIHRMHAFVRFEKLQDEMFFAKIAPDFNVLPLIINHFKARYRDQQWMIFDTARHYGIIYDLNDVEFFYPNAEQIQQLCNAEDFHHDEERQYQKLWQRYFVKTGIPERRNMKLHIQWMPKRYWKYLTEKQ